MSRSGWLAAAVCLAPFVAHGEAPLPEYPGTRLTRIGNGLELNGESYRMAYFVTKDPLETVAMFFHHAFHRQGIPCTVDGNPREALVVSAFYTREGMQRSIVLRTHGRDTVGFSVVHGLFATPALPAPQAGVHREGTLEGPAEAELIPAALPQVRERVLAQLAAAGWVRVPGQGSGTLIEHTRHGEHLLIVLAEAGPALTAVMHLHESPAP